MSARTAQSMEATQTTATAEATAAAEGGPLDRTVVALVPLLSGCAPANDT
jgi:hypothetical protein